MTLLSLTAAILLAGCGDDGPSRIYGKWKQGPAVLEFSDKTFVMGPMTLKVAKYETSKDKITVFVEGEPAGLTFNFKSDKEMCVDGAAPGSPLGGCFTKA